ncbi:MAG: hypothetical protein Q9161_009207 [Pseudevernia consocians]
MSIFFFSGKRSLQTQGMGSIRIAKSEMTLNTPVAWKVALTLKQWPVVISGDLKYGLHEIEYQIAPDAEVDPNIDEHVAFAGGCEDPKVLEQDGELDEEDHKAVDNR